MKRTVGLWIEPVPGALAAAVAALDLDTTAASADVWVVDAATEGLPGDAAWRIAVYDAADSTAAFAGLGVRWAEVVACDAPEAEWVARLRSLMARYDEADRARRTLGWIGHDLNNPLAALRILAEVAAMDAEDPERKRDAADMLEAVDAAGVLVDVLHAAARGEDNGILMRNDAHRSMVDRGALARDALDRPCFAPHVAWVEGDPSGPDDGFLAEPGTLRSAYTLLFWNARRLTAEGQRFRVRWDSPRRLCVTSVGVEVSESDAAALCEPGGALALRERRLPVSPVGLTLAAALFGDSGASLTARAVGAEVEVVVEWPG
jgi:hypothetical protein